MDGAWQQTHIQFFPGFLIQILRGMWPVVASGGWALFTIENDLVDHKNNQKYMLYKKGMLKTKVCPEHSRDELRICVTEHRKISQIGFLSGYEWSH